MKHFSPLLPKKSFSPAASTTTPDLTNLPSQAVWASMAARVGSTTENGLGGWYSYRASKAGVISLTKTFDLHLQTRSGERAMAIALHPGTVKTGFSKEFWGGVEEGKLFSAEVGHVISITVWVDQMGSGSMRQPLVLV